MKYGFFFLFFLKFSIHAQSIANIKFNFIKPDTKLFVIGEIHFEEDSDLQLALIDYIKNNTEVDVFIIELSPEVGKIFNQYVLYGERENDVREINQLLYKHTAYKINLILDFLRNHNLSNARKIQVMGVDLYSYHKFRRQMTGLRIIFPELKSINLPIARENIVNPKVRNHMYGMSFYRIKCLIQEVEEYPEQYQQLLGQRFDVYKEYLNQVKFDYLYDHSSLWRKKDSIREAHLAKNLVEIIDSHKVSLMLCGAAHALTKMDDDWNYGYPISSMTAVAKQKYPDQIFSIIMHQHDKKFKRSIADFNLLEKPISDYVDDDSVKYIVIDEQETSKSKGAKERGNMVIIHNKFYKAKKQRSKP